MITKTPESLLQEALETRAHSRFDDTLTLLVEGMRAFPDFKDAHGHEAFAKEIVRTYILQEDYSSALHKLFTFGLDLYEHAILFARAYLAANNLEAARAWWIKVWKRRPTHPEVIAFFNEYPPTPPKDNTPVVSRAPKEAPQIAQITSSFPAFDFTCAFDVGANVGLSVPSLQALSGDIWIHCFEPSPTSFSALHAKYANDPRVRLNNTALSDTRGQSAFTDHGSSTMNRIGPDGNLFVPTITLTQYCNDNGIRRIDYLKIDTEGHELRVLSGADPMLQDVAFIEVEASMNPYNRYHASYADLSMFLFERGFYLFGIFEQVREWGGGGLPILRRANPVFVHQRLIGAIPSGVIVI